MEQNGRYERSFYGTIAKLRPFKQYLQLTYSDLLKGNPD